MRTCLSFSLLFLLALFSFAQSVSTISPNQANLGQNLNVSISGTGGFTGATGVILSSGATNIQATSYTVTSPTQATASFSIPANSSFAGQYDVYVGSGAAFLPNGFLVNNVGGGTNQAYLRGAVYGDLNNNCTFDGTDFYLQNRIVTIEPGGYLASTNSLGEFGIWLPVGNYTVYPPAPGQFGPSCPDSVNINLANPGQTYPIGDFAIAPDPNLDVLAAGIYSTITRPGFSFRIYPFCRNRYIFSPQIQGTLAVYIDTVVTVDSISIPPLYVSNDTFYFDFNLQFSQELKPVFYARVPTIPTVALGQQLCFYAGTDYPADGDQTNNENLFCRNIVGSYDPNDKRIVRPAGVGDSSGVIHPDDTHLTYMIRFQNTGTDTAFNIVVRDTIKGNLNAASLNMEDASHDYVFTMGANGEAEWLFPNILLVDSNRNEPASHGFILFDIDRVPGLGIGDSVWNTAHIYFDFNPAVITNRAVHLIDTLTVGIDPVTETNFLRVYPVPVGEKLMLDWGEVPPEKGLMLMLDAHGRELKRVEFQGVLPRSLDTKGLAPGIFFLRLETETGTWTEKLIKR